ncbi:ATP-dependent helicase [uncultured Thiocystis sp.]|uniref:3'-5' exonuclease n=1 Tax=uncultured Thiocystis sp. TaxID=1202134 RepID=UPI0025F64BB1|nr:ATP-dependent helicase [uncultured Thiocystis sp.]
MARDRLLAGLRFLLIDEYQDINGDHYDLISAVAGRTLQSEEDRLSLLAVGDDDQNIYAFDGANVRYIRQFEADYQARRSSLIENYRSSGHIVACANRVIARARDRMKAGQDIRVNHARRDQPAGGDHATLDPVTGGRVQILEVPQDPRLEVQMALVELQRLSALEPARRGQWGRFAVMARRWEDLEPLAALCRRRRIPVRLLRDAQQPNLHTTREGHTLLSLLRGAGRRTGRTRVLLRAGTLSRWFRRRYGVTIDALIEHPFRAALAQLISEIEWAVPGGERVVADLIDALYEFGPGGKALAEARPNGPLMLMTAHRAKGLEFDHALILDSGGWRRRDDDERRLFYVAMTRARQSLTLCEAMGRPHPFVGETDGLALRTRPAVPALEPTLANRFQLADPEQIVLSWPGYFAPCAPIHRALAALEVGHPLMLRARPDGHPGWELADLQGVAVTRMSAKFRPPDGEIVAVRVAAVLVRYGKEDQQGLRCPCWELILPESLFPRRRPETLSSGFLKSTRA